MLQVLRHSIQKQRSDKVLLDPPPDVENRYINALHADTTPEEVHLTVGVNAYPAPPNTAGGLGAEGRLSPVFEPGERLMMSYYTAKRLMVVLAQILQHHEQQFGEVQLDPAQRTIRTGGANPAKC